MQRYRVTISKYIWADSDEEALNMVQSEISDFERKSDNSLPVMESLEHAEFGKIKSLKTIH